MLSAETPLSPIRASSIRESEESMSESSPELGSAALEEVTRSAFNGVLRAVEARNLSIDQFPGPILVGIIAWPELSQQAARFGSAGGQAPTE